MRNFGVKTWKTNNFRKFSENYMPLLRQNWNFWQKVSIVGLCGMLSTTPNRSRNHRFGTSWFLLNFFLFFDEFVLQKFAFWGSNMSQKAKQSGNSCFLGKTTPRTLIINLEIILLCFGGAVHLEAGWCLKIVYLKQ